MTVELCFCPNVLQHVISCLVPHDWPNQNLQPFSSRHPHRGVSAFLHLEVPALTQFIIRLRCVTLLGLLGKASSDPQEACRPAAGTEVTQRSWQAASHLPLPETWSVSLSVRNRSTSRTRGTFHPSVSQSIASSVLHTDQTYGWPDAVWGFSTRR